MNLQHIETIFRYHPPHGDQAQRYERLRAAGGEFARLIVQLCPESGERVLAIRRVQEAVMYANASIACNEGKPLAPTGTDQPGTACVVVCDGCGGPIDAAGGFIVNTGEPSQTFHPRCAKSVSVTATQPSK